MYPLNKNNREALVIELQKASKRIEKIEKINADKNTNHVIEDFNHMELFLLEKKVELIRSSLINNEIDY